MTRPNQVTWVSWIAVLTYFAICVMLYASR